MRVSILRYTVFLLPLLAGCLFQHDCYQLEVKPDGDALQRKLTCWHDVGGNDGKQIGPVSFSQLAALSRIYPQRESENDGKKHVFIGRFSGNTPADVGGAGSYTHFTSSMGSTSCYVERFRGDDDAAAQLAKRRQSAERLCDLLLGWMTAELGQQPGFPRLKNFSTRTSGATC